MGATDRQPPWLGDLVLAEHYHWSQDDIDALPQWRYERALLWLDVQAAYRTRQLEQD